MPPGTAAGASQALSAAVSFLGQRKHGRHEPLHPASLPGSTQHSHFRMWVMCKVPAPSWNLQVYSGLKDCAHPIPNKSCQVLR